MNEATDERDNDQHDRRDAVQIKPHREGNPTERNPLNCMRLWIGGDLSQQQERTDERDEHCSSG